ncbi:MAG: ABC transporter ATP-binding protein [Planctomycetaceae bacterium]
MNSEATDQKLDGGALVLEQLSALSERHDRNAPRRVMSEVVRAWPGDVRRLWWKWFSEAARSLGIRCKTVDCTVDEALELVHNGAQIVNYDEHADTRWLAVLESRGRRFQIATGNTAAPSQLVRLSALRRKLSAAASDGKLRCVVMQLPSTGKSRSHGQHGLSPIERLQQLLQPEWSDIWLVLVFAFVVGLLMLATPIAVESLINTVAFGRFLQPIVVLALILLTFLGFQAAVRALQTYVVEIIQRRLFARVAADLAHRLPRAEVESLDREYAPELTNRFFDVVTVQKVSAQLLLDGVGLVLSTIVGMAVLGFYHPWLLGFDVLLLASIAFIIFVLGRGAVSSAMMESKNKYYMAAWLEDIARCPTAFRSDGGAEFALERADGLIHQYLIARRGHFRILMRQILFALMLQAIASTVLLGIGGWLVVAQELTLGQLVAAELIVAVIVGAFAKLGKHMESYYDLLASVDKLGVLFDLPTERHDGMLGTIRRGPIALEINSVSYSFVGGTSAVNSVSAKIPEGTSLAVCGGSGSGKSTLLDLIFGLRCPTAGHLTVAGFDPRDLRPDVLRDRVALVRGSEVFHATIDENVHLHREDISAAETRDALAHAGLYDAVMDLDDGCDTVLASGGAPLTENQCRLLGISRAIAGQPGLLLIDGVLDSLSDGELETVLSFLLAPERPWTLIIATGRTAIADRCARRIDLRKTTGPIIA